MKNILLFGLLLLCSCTTDEYGNVDYTPLFIGSTVGILGAFFAIKISNATHDQKSQKDLPKHTDSIWDDPKYKEMAERVEKWKEKEKDMESYSFNVVGMQYRPLSTKKIIDHLTGGESIDLIPEPRNRYDKNAIKALVYDDIKMKNVCIGYVPADEAIEIRKLIDDNPCYHCSIDRVVCDLDGDYFSISAEIKY